MKAFNFIPFILLLLFVSIDQQNFFSLTERWGNSPAIQKFFPSNTSYDKEVPVLCYHHINQSVTGKSLEYRISLDNFRSHIKMLNDSGYNTIVPEQLYEHLSTGASLPSKPVMLTFDDTHEEHFSLVAPILDEYNYKAVFFVTAVAIGKPHYMTKAQIKSLSDIGHVIGHHTWDHPDMRKLTAKDYVLQLQKAEQLLEQITGKPVQCFAFPYGSWNYSTIQELKSYKIKIAFQLSGRSDKKEGLYTVRRMLIHGSWTPGALHQRINILFR